MIFKKFWRKKSYKEKANDFWKHLNSDVCCDSFTKVYILWADNKNKHESEPIYMIGFESFDDANKYRNNMEKHLYDLGYTHVGIKRCYINKYVDL